MWKSVKTNKKKNTQTNQQANVSQYIIQTQYNIIEYNTIDNEAAGSGC